MACVQSRVQARIISARLRRKREVRAVARGVRWPPSDRCWVTLMAQPGVEEVEVATRCIFQRVSLRSATPTTQILRILPPTINCAPCCQPPACSSPALPCIVPSRRAKCESHIFSRPFVSQCKLICVDKRRRSSAVGGRVRPRGSGCVRHTPQPACLPPRNWRRWVGGCVV